MVADVAGFSRLMERDESLTFTRLRHLREQVTFPKVEKYGGRVIKTTGDGFLAEFGSAVAAVRCGIDFQRSVIELEATQADADRIHFRIGLNLGDIIIDGEDVAGDGVNIAARLEALSPMDGMCISSSVHEQIRDALGVGFDDMGEQTLKNISRPIRAYAVRIGSAQPETAQQAPPPAVTPGPSLDHLVQFDINFDAVLGAGGDTRQESANVSAGAQDKTQWDAVANALMQASEQVGTGAQSAERAEVEAKRDKVERSLEDAPARLPTEEQERLRAEEQGRLRAEERARELEYAKTQAQLDAALQEARRKFAKTRTQPEAQQAAKVEQAPVSRQDARARAMEDAKARARAEAALQSGKSVGASAPAPLPRRKPFNWGKPVALTVVLSLLLGLVLVHLVSFDRLIPQFEQLAGAYLRQPVEIKALHLALLPRPHWRLERVTVGSEGQLAVARINAVAELDSMFSDQKVFKSIELESPVLNEQGLIALLFGKPKRQELQVPSIVVRNGKFASKSLVLPALDAKISMNDDGSWQKIALETPDHKTSLLLEPTREGIQLALESNAFSVPFDPAIILEDFSAKGVLGRVELRLREFKGGIYGGYLSGNANLNWGGDWGMRGEISARAMDPAILAPTLLQDGRLEGKSAYTMRAKSYGELFAAPRMEGTFAVQKGSLLGVDLGRLLHDGSIGGKTAFAELSGSFVREGGRTQLRQVRLVSGPLSAAGSVDADASQNLSGRFGVDLNSPIAQAHSAFAVSGTLKSPRFSR